MVRNARFAILATVAVVFANSAALAGSLNSYNSANTPVVAYTAAPEPTVLQPAYAPAPVTNTSRDGFYDGSKGDNNDLGYTQSHACGGALDGATCLVILNDHMRRVRLEREAGTILVGNPTIADVTVLGKDTIFVSARSIGSTNIIVLDENNDEIRTFEVFVREPTTKRVVLRNAGAVENYQCAPDCLRALTQSDSPGQHSATAGVVQTDIALDQMAIGLQSGTNPNTDPTALAGAQGGPAQPGAVAATQQLGGTVAPIVGAVDALAGNSGPAVTSAPPAVAN